MGAGVTSAENTPANPAGNAHQRGASSSADSSSEFGKVFQQAKAACNPTIPTPREEALQRSLPVNERYQSPPSSQTFHGQVHDGGAKTATQDSRSAVPSRGAPPAATDSKTADAHTRDRLLGQDATGLKPGEQISAKLTTKEDIRNPQAEMTFDFSKKVTKDQAAAILFQRGKVPGGATLVQGQGNQWTVQYRNNIYAKQDVVKSMNSHTESVITRNKLPGEMFYPEPDVTFSWVGGATAFNTTSEGPARRDLKNDMGFVISKHYPLDEGQSPDKNVRRMVKPGPGYEVVFDKPKTADQVKETFFEKGVRDDQVRVIPVGKAPTTTWQVQMLDGMTDLKMPAARALQDANVYAKESIAPGTPDGIKAHIQNQTVPANAKKLGPDVFVWEQDGHIVRVETNGKKGDAGYYKYEQTKLHPTDQQGNNTMRWLMMEKGLPVRTAWQEYDKHWDQIHTGMLSMVGGGGRYMPRYPGGGGAGPRSAWQEPIAARSRNGGAGNSGNGGSSVDPVSGGGGGPRGRPPGGGGGGEPPRTGGPSGDPGATGVFTAPASSRVNIVSPVYNISGRDVIIVETSVGRQAFYRSSGKNSGQPDKWFPVDEFRSSDGWFNKAGYARGPGRQLGEPLHRLGTEEFARISDVLDGMNIPRGMKAPPGTTENAEMTMNRILDFYGARITPTTRQRPVSE